MILENPYLFLRNFPLSVTVCKHRYTDVHYRTPAGEQVFGLKELLSPNYRRPSHTYTRPPPNAYHTLLRKVVAAYLAMLDRLLRTLLDGVLSPWSSCFGTAHKHDNIIRENSKTTTCLCESLLQHLVVDLGMRNPMSSRDKLTYVESPRSEVRPSRAHL